MPALRITAEDFERMFQLPAGSLPSRLKSQLQALNTSFHWANEQETREYLDMFESRIAAPVNQRTSAETLAAFEKGWGENFQQLLEKGISAEVLKPGYFRGSKFLRYSGKILVTENLQLEFDLFGIARQILFERYLSGYDCIWELGSGSGQNLLMLAELFPDASLHGCDWTIASKQIANYLGQQLQRLISGNVFDMLSCAQAPAVPTDAALISIHAFEQLGQDFHSVLQYILRCRPAIVMQYEPVLEFYNAENTFDALALRYCRKRNYLEGYYSALLQLAEQGKIEILAAFRPELGGVLHESSVLVWKPS
jgi:hypothetical protein